MALFSANLKLMSWGGYTSRTADPYQSLTEVNRHLEVLDEGVLGLLRLSEGLQLAGHRCSWYRATTSWNGVGPQVLVGGLVADEVGVVLHGEVEDVFLEGG